MSGPWFGSEFQQLMARFDARRIRIEEIRARRDGCFEIADYFRQLADATEREHELPESLLLLSAGHRAFLEYAFGFGWNRWCS